MSAKSTTAYPPVSRRNQLLMELAELDAEESAKPPLTGYDHAAILCQAQGVDVPRVTMELQTLSFQIGECTDAVTRLEHQLTPIMMPRAGDEKAAASPEPPRCPHAAEIGGNTECVRRLTKRLYAVLDALEI